MGSLSGKRARSVPLAARHNYAWGKKAHQQGSSALNTSAFVMACPTAGHNIITFMPNRSFSDGNCSFSDGNCSNIDGGSSSSFRGGGLASTAAIRAGAKSRGIVQHSLLLYILDNIHYLRGKEREKSFPLIIGPDHGASHAHGRCVGAVAGDGHPGKRTGVPLFGSVALDRWARGSG